MSYPIYVPSRGRYDRSFTSEHLKQHGIPFSFVVEPDEADHYRAAYPHAEVLVLPESNQGISYSRNWIKDYSHKQGDGRHWQADDDIKAVKQWVKGKRVPCDTAAVLQQLADWTDRYTNIAVAGLMHVAFGFRIPAPFSMNQAVYSLVLLDNSTPYKWRDDTIEDVDYALQALAAGDCTVLWHLFQIEVAPSPTGPEVGGNEWDNERRLGKAKSLQRHWPGMIRIVYRFGRPNFSAAHLWRKFDQQLVRA